MPDPATFQYWKRSFLAIVIAESGRGADCAAWLNEVSRKGSVHEDFHYVEPRWRSFDAKLQSALKAIISGDLLVLFGTEMDLNFAEGDLLSSRSTLHMLYQ
eukprot:12572009-Heterocapsa_arctica.AAC.1